MDYPPPPVIKQEAADPSGQIVGEGSDQVVSEAGPRPGQAAIARAFPGCGGVYLLTDEQDRLVQLSAAADLRRALRGRLLDPPVETEEPISAMSRRKARLGEIVRRIRWQPAHSAFEMDYRYLCLARQIMPDTYLKSLSFGPAWFVQVSPEASIPRFLSGKVLAEGTAAIGPFPTQPDANRFIQVLEDAFDLCRCHPVLEQAPHGPPCAYYEMGKCLGACAGLIPMEQYRGMIRAALAFAGGDREPAFSQWERQMRQLAGEWAYEKAAAVKQRIERARAVEQAAFRLVRPVEGFNYLVVQRGRGRITVKPFFVVGGSIEPGDPVSLKKLDEAVPRWCSAFASDRGRKREAAEDLQHLSEQIWLVSHYLFRNEPPGLFCHAAELDNVQSLCRRIRERFERPSRDEMETPT